MKNEKCQSLVLLSALSASVVNFHSSKQGSRRKTKHKYQAKSQNKSHKSNEIHFDRYGTSIKKEQNTRNKKNSPFRSKASAEIAAQVELYTFFCGDWLAIAHLHQFLSIAQKRFHQLGRSGLCHRE